MIHFHVHPPLRAAMVALVLATRATAAEVTAYFSPDGGLMPAVVAQIDAATSSIDVMAYSISHSQVTAALTRADKRGVAVRLIVNPTQQSTAYSSAPTIRKAGVPVRVDRRHALMHNKTMVLDSHTVITGSANFSAAAATKNAENIVIIVDQSIADQFAADFQKHWSHSEPFKTIQHDDWKPNYPPDAAFLSPNTAHEKEP